HAVVVCPAFPTTGRTLYQGHLFVFDKLLNESGLQNHPLNPMTDADIRRWLAQQSQTPPAHIDYATVTQGSQAIAAELSSIAQAQQRLVVVDAVVDDDLRSIGTACADATLITGGSGIALGLPQNFRQQGTTQ
ncbi:MAG: four-carbon acid sugar kinase family protein, partial [Pseudomonadota bacterium]